MKKNKFSIDPSKKDAIAKAYLALEGEKLDLFRFAGGGNAYGQTYNRETQYSESTKYTRGPEEEPVNP